MAVKTFRHSDCEKDGKDTFDETVTGFLREQGDDNIMSVTPIEFSNDEKKPVDYGVIVVFKETLPE